MPSCRAFVRSREAVGTGLATHLPFFFREGGLDSALKLMTDTLKQKENPLHPDEASRHRVVATLGLGRLEPLHVRTLDLARLCRQGRLDHPAHERARAASGKERLRVSFQHESSARKRGPFLAHCVVAVPETLLESELFGISRGYFCTGGNRNDRAGSCSRAANGGGTLAAG